jgi:hypothetical protein
MAYQAGSGQPWPHVGSCSSDGDDQPLTSQAFDIGTPPDLSGSLKSLDASSSDLPWSTQKSTVLTPTTDIVFGSDKPDLTEGYAGFNTGAERPSNPMFGDVTSAPELHSIDPRRLLREQALGEDMSPSACHHQSSRFLLSMDASSEAGNGLPNQISYPNDSALTLQEAEMTPNTTELSSDTLSYLELWMWYNPGRLPSMANLKSIENLSHAPGKGKAMMDWLKSRVALTPENNTPTNPRLAKLLQRGDEAREYRPKCVSSRQRKILSGESKLFACTNRCGQTFHRKGDWARHERTNFEEWACYVCTEALTRKEHLRTHLKDSHDMQETNLEKYRHQLLAPINRPCGFCGKRFSSWGKWLAHVGAHFEGSIRGRRWKMSEWKERKMTAPGSGRPRQRSSGHHYNGGDDDDDDSSDAGDNNDDGTGPNNGGGGALNSSYQASQNTSGVGQGRVLDHSFGSTYGNFNGFSGGATSQTHGNVQRTPSLRYTDEVEAPVDHTQEIVHSMATLDVSAAKIRSSSGACGQAPSYAPSPTNSKELSRVKSLAADVSARTVTVPSRKEKRQIGESHTKYSSTYGKGATVPSHKEKRQIDRPQTKYSSTYGEGVISAAMLRWLDEPPSLGPWSPLTRLDWVPKADESNVQAGKKVDTSLRYGKPRHEQWNAVTRFGLGAKLDDPSPSYSPSESRF